MILFELLKKPIYYYLPMYHSGYRLLKEDLIEKYNIQNVKSFSVSFNRSIKNLEKKLYIRQTKKGLELRDYDYLPSLNKLNKSVGGKS